jgi:hypothetical protein
MYLCPMDRPIAHSLTHTLGRLSSNPERAAEGGDLTHRTRTDLLDPFESESLQKPVTEGQVYEIGPE